MPPADILSNKNPYLEFYSLTVMAVLWCDTKATYRGSVAKTSPVWEICEVRTHDQPTAECKLYKIKVARSSMKRSWFNTSNLFKHPRVKTVVSVLASSEE